MPFCVQYTIYIEKSIETMGKKQIIRLTESDVHKIVKESVNKLLSEGSTSQEDYNKWLDAEEKLGASNVLNAIWNYLDGDKLHQIVEWLNDDYDLWPDEEEEEDIDFEEEGY